MLKVAYRILLIIVALSLSGCGAIGQLLASATPTTTNTPTATNTPTITATPTQTATPTATATATPVPPPPVAITGCLSQPDCPHSRLIQTFFAAGQDPAAGGKYPVTLPAGTLLRFNWGWCALDQLTLLSNIKNYQFIFSIDGVSYLDRLEQGGTSMTDSQDPSATYPCISVGGYLTGWQPGVSHTITIGGRVTAAMSDGWDSYTPGESVISYVLNPVDVTDTPVATATFTPTLTPTRTLTPIPLPTYTPAPYIAPTAAACGETGTIDLDNETGGIVNIFLKGPAAYSYDLPAGSTKYTVCGGSYTFTAYGCGGGSISGKIGTSQDTYYKFSCN